MPTRVPSLIGAPDMTSQIRIVSSSGPEVPFGENAPHQCAHIEACLSAHLTQHLSRARGNTRAIGRECDQLNLARVPAKCLTESNKGHRSDLPTSTDRVFLNARRILRKAAEPEGEKGKAESWMCDTLCPIRYPNAFMNLPASEMMASSSGLCSGDLINSTESWAGEISIRIKKR